MKDIWINNVISNRNDTCSKIGMKQEYRKIVTYSVETPTSVGYIYMTIML